MKHAKLTLEPRQAEMLMEIALRGFADLREEIDEGGRFSSKDYIEAANGITKLARAMSKVKEGKA